MNEANEKSDDYLLIYGDESVNNNIVCYTICYFERHLNKKAEEVLQSIKDKYNVPKDYFLHCRELFNGSERKKLEFNLSLQDVENMYRDIAIVFRSASILSCYIDKRTIKRKELSVELSPGKKNTIYFEDKNLIHMCKNGCMANIIRNKKSDEYSFYPDPDKKSVMKYFKTKKAKVSNEKYNISWANGSLAYESTNLEDVRLKHTSYTNGEKAPLIQLADFFAYSFSKATCIQNYKNKDYFIEIQNILSPITIVYEIYNSLFNKK